jgi:uncharacterized protein with GYD domain
MAKYLLEASYTAEGAKGLAKEGGSSRRKKVEEMVNAMHGKVEAFYYAFGATDVYLIVDVPDAVTAVALSLAVNQSGAVQLSTRVPLTAEEMVQAAKKSVSYRAPGQQSGMGGAPCPPSLLWSYGEAQALTHHRAEAAGRG